MALISVFPIPAFHVHSPPRLHAHPRQFCHRKFQRKQAYYLSCVKIFCSKGHDHHLPLYDTFKFTRCLTCSTPHLRPKSLGTGEVGVISSKE